LEFIFIILVAGAALLVPVGSLLGFLAFRQRDRHASRVEALSREVATLRQELAALKSGNAFGEFAQATADLAPEQAPAAAPVYPAQAESQVVPEENPPQATPTPPPQPRQLSLETRLINALKANWMVWLGGLSVSLAGIFMVSHSISAGLIGPVQQFALALLSGLALHAGAEYLRRRHTGTDQVFAALAGGGSITLYAALLAGVRHYELIGPVTGLILLAVVSLATMALALVHGPLLAVMGLFGAYVVPLLVGGEGGSVLFVLSYSFLITLSSMLLMRRVYRDWLWYGTLLGALGWWLLAGMGSAAMLATAGYLSALFVLFSMWPGEVSLSGERRREALIALLAAWAVSIYQQPATEPLFLAWLFILPVAILSPSGRGAFWYLPWLAVLATVVGWLGFAAKASGEFLLVTLAEEQHGIFLTYLMLAAVITLMSGLWQWRQQLQLRRWASLVMLAPVIWLLLGWLLLVPAGEASGAWALVSLFAGGVYGALAWRLEQRSEWRAGLAWALLAAHASYSLAVVMWLQEASLTLALAAQFVSLVWLARRYQASELYWLLKLVLAVVVARLTFNPWLDNYQAASHWTLLTYVGAAGFAVAATWLAGRSGAIRPWLEGASLHLVVLFMGVALRFALYDGDIFVRDYSLTEAAINTLLWGSVSVVYVIRARASETLVWLYRLFAWILLAMAGLSYLVAVVVHNPWWTSGVIGATPVFNLLLLAYGAPVLLALVISRYRELVPRHWALAVAGAAFLLFTALEIRQIWQGSAMPLQFGMGEGELYTYSVVGMLYAVAAILWSARNHSLMLHKVGMALLGVVIAKIFLVDMSGLQGLWRVAAFMGLGLALLGLAWVYRRSRKL